MNILLINPRYPKLEEAFYQTYNRIWPPLCLMNCGAIFEQQAHDVEIIDMNVSRLKSKDIDNKIKLADKIFITSSTYDRWQCPILRLGSLFDQINKICAINENVYLMGYHPTVSADLFFNKTKVRRIILGEPELTVEKIAKSWDFKKIPGVAYLDENNKIVINQSQDFAVDIDNLPSPARHLVNFRDYYYEILGSNFAVFEFSRGCPFECSFCSDIMYGVGLRRKSIEKIKLELQEAIEKNNVKAGYFLDQVFTFDKTLVSSICDFLIEKKYKFKWCVQTRTDLVDRDILLKMKKAGCVLIHYGIESGSDNVLKNVKKGIDLAIAKEAVRITRQLGIRTMCFFMIGFLGETEEDMAKTFNLANTIDATYVAYRINVDFVNFFKNYEYNIEHLDFEKYKRLGELIKKQTLFFYFNPKNFLRIIFTSDFKTLLLQAKLFFKNFWY